MPAKRSPSGPMTSSSASKTRSSSKAGGTSSSSSDLRTPSFPSAANATTLSGRLQHNNITNTNNNNTVIDGRPHEGGGGGGDRGSRYGSSLRSKMTNSQLAGNGIAMTTMSSNASSGGGRYRSASNALGTSSANTATSTSTAQRSSSVDGGVRRSNSLPRSQSPSNANISRTNIRGVGGVGGGGGAAIVTSNSSVGGGLKSNSRAPSTATNTTRLSQQTVHSFSVFGVGGGVSSNSGNAVGGGGGGFAAPPAPSLVRSSSASKSRNILSNHSKNAPLSPSPPPPPATAPAASLSSAYPPSRVDSLVIKRTNSSLVSKQRGGGGGGGTTPSSSPRPLALTVGSQKGNGGGGGGGGGMAASSSCSPLLLTSPVFGGGGGGGGVASPRHFVGINAVFSDTDDDGGGVAGMRGVGGGYTSSSGTSSDGVGDGDVSPTSKRRRRAAAAAGSSEGRRGGGGGGGGGGKQQKGGGLDGNSDQSFDNHYGLSAALSSAPAAGGGGGTASSRSGTPLRSTTPLRSAREQTTALAAKANVEKMLTLEGSTSSQQQQRPRTPVMMMVSPAGSFSFRSQQRDAPASPRSAQPPMDLSALQNSASTPTQQPLSDNKLTSPLKHQNSNHGKTGAVSKHATSPYLRQLQLQQQQLLQSPLSNSLRSDEREQRKGEGGVGAGGYPPLSLDPTPSPPPPMMQSATAAPNRGVLNNPPSSLPSLQKGAVSSSPSFLPRTFGGFSKDSEAPRQTLARLRERYHCLHTTPKGGTSASNGNGGCGGGGGVPQHVINIVQLCKNHIPLFHYFQVAEVLIPLASDAHNGSTTASQQQQQQQQYTYGFYWAPRNDLLARSLQMFEVMGYRNTLYRHIFEHMTARAADVVGRNASFPASFPSSATAGVARQSQTPSPTPATPPSPTSSCPTATTAANRMMNANASLQALAVCATVLDLFAPDAPVPSLFLSRSALQATVGDASGGGARRDYQRQRNVVWGDDASGAAWSSMVSSHSSFEVVRGGGGGGGSADLSPFSSCDVLPFLTSAEGNRWQSEQEYVLASILYSIASATATTTTATTTSGNRTSGAPAAAPIDCTMGSFLAQDVGFGPRSGPALCAAADALLFGVGGGGGAKVHSPTNSKEGGSSSLSFATISGASPSLTADEQSDLAYWLLSSHPVVYVALKAVPPPPPPSQQQSTNSSFTSSRQQSALVAAQQFAKTEEAKSFIEAWSRQAATMFVAPCPRHNHVMRVGGCGGGRGGGSGGDGDCGSFIPQQQQHNHLTPFEVLSRNSVGNGYSPPPSLSHNLMTAAQQQSADAARWQTLFGCGALKGSRVALKWIVGGGGIASSPTSDAQTRLFPAAHDGDGDDFLNNKQQPSFFSSVPIPPSAPIIISSDVECGSMAPRAERYDPSPTLSHPKPTPTFLFRGCGDTTDDDCKRVWYRFVLKGAPHGSTVAMRAMNMAPHGRLYRSGMRPVCRFNAPLSVVCGESINHNRVVSPSLGTFDHLKRHAQWHLVPTCGFLPVRNDEEAEISFSVSLPPAGGGLAPNAPSNASVGGPSSIVGGTFVCNPYVFRCGKCLALGRSGGDGDGDGEGGVSYSITAPQCIQCRIKTWLLLGVFEANVNGADARSSNDKAAAAVYSLVLPPALQPTIHIAFCEPYSYGSLLSHISLWHSVVKRSPSNIRFEERVLCHTADGRKLHLLIVTSLAEKSARQEMVAAMQGGGGGGGGDGGSSSSKRSSSTAGRPRGGSGGTSKGSGGIRLHHGPLGWSQLMEMQSFYTAGTAPPPLIGDFSSGKKVILLSGRIHPSEVTGSYALHGLVQFLLSADPRAAQLRDNFIFFIVPMLNPDGVSRGHNRQDQFGDNLNRCYNNPHPDTQPTVLALKNVFDFLQQHYKDRFIFYLDFHSHASQLLGFAFGNCLSAALQPWNMLFPRLVDAHSNGLFSTSGSKFAKAHMDKKDGTSRVLFGASLMHSYTMELTHFAHLQWSPSQGFIGGGISTSQQQPTHAGGGGGGQIVFSVQPPPPHEDWERYTGSALLMDEDGTAHSNIEPWFVVLRQSAEVGRACVLALLDYCAIGTPPTSTTAKAASSSPTLITSVNQLGRPSDALLKAGGMERLVKESRQSALKTLQPAAMSSTSQSSAVGGGGKSGGKSGGLAPNARGGWGGY